MILSKIRIASMTPFKQPFISICLLDGIRSSEEYQQNICFILSIF